MAAAVSDNVLVIGEIHTGLLHNSTAVSALSAARLVDLVPGQRVRSSTRPIVHARSAELLTGVDCALSGASGASVRLVGTASSGVMITGGHVLQGSTHAVVRAGSATRRLAWSHYLARPGVVETTGRTDQASLAEGFLGTDPQAGQLNLGAISRRLMDSVQDSVELDHRSAFRSPRIRLRWVLTDARVSSDAHRSAAFTVTGETSRTLWLAGTGPHDIPASVEFCEDLALHDWLLTTLLTLIDRSRIGSSPRSAVVERLRPAIDYLLHLWMPAARLDQARAELWHGLAARPGLTRQWDASVNRIRDQLAMGAIEQFSGG